MIPRRLRRGASLLRFSKKLASLDLEYLEDSDTQNLITKVRDSYLWQIPDSVRVWNYVFANFIGIVAACIALIPFGWWIPVVIIAVTLPRFYFKLRHGNFVWSMYGSGAPQAKKLWYYGWLLTDTLPILETRIFQSQQKLLSKMEDTQNYLYDLNKKPLENYKWILIFAPVLETSVAFLIVWLFVPNVLIGLLSIGSITFIIATLESLRSNTAWAAAHVGELYEKSLFIEPFFKLMSLPKKIIEKEKAQFLSDTAPPKIEFRNVSFTYPNGRQALKDISFIIHPAENVALVGNNGAGKTTIIKLLCRFYDVSSGSILINGINIKDLSLSNWYSHLGTLFQDFMKFQFTVRENIMLGKTGLEDEARMKKAALESGADEFIKQFPKTYDQVLGKRFEDGDELSGGQWQKLAIARAFYQQAPILIMDEPTSAIDAEAEYEIFNNLERLYSDKTLILVSHRFSTVRNANKIFVIDGGKIIEQGSHKDLLKLKGKYAHLFNIQARGYQ